MSLSLEPEKFLMVYGQNAESWANRFGLEPFTHPCYACGAELRTTQPFFCGELRGLIARRCSCGDAWPPYCVVRDPKYGDILDGAR
jgi:hypothetical protein